MGLLGITARYDAIVKSVEIGYGGYWVVTFSCAPGVDMPVTVCQNGISRDQARELAAQTLLTITGQKVTA